MNLILWIEFTDGTETKQQTYADLRGIPIPTIGDYICPGKGQYKILTRTFNYAEAGLTVYFLCEAVPEKTHPPMKISQEALERASRKG
jgi:hypothetical protein